MDTTEQGEYFEEDKKMEIDTKRSNLVNHVCDICNKNFNSKGVLRRHFESDHEKVKYPCIQCDKVFTQLGALKTHTKIMGKPMWFATWLEIF